MLYISALDGLFTLKDKILVVICFLIDIDTVIHFAAESRVDRSILGPEAFMKTNVMGTFTLLDVARNYWKKDDGTIRDDVQFNHI